MAHVLLPAVAGRADDRPTTLDRPLTICIIPQRVIPRQHGTLASKGGSRELRGHSKRKESIMKRRNRRNGRAAIRGRVLPDDACPSCGTMMKEMRGRLRLPINGEEITVPSASHLSCPKCGEIVLRFQEAKRLHEDAIGAYRRSTGFYRPMRSGTSGNASISSRQTWRACCGWAPTRFPVGSRDGTCRPGRWTSCCVSSETCRAASSTYVTARPE